MRVGGIQSAPGVPAAIAPEAAGTRRADPEWGIGDAVLGRHRGALARNALPGRDRRSFGPQRAGTSKARTAAHPRGKRNPTEWRKRHTPKLEDPRK